MYRILYVDDDPGLLDIGKLFLEEKGQFSVDTSLSASAGLDLLASAHYDAVISDYQMPGMDGIEFLKMVRTSGNTIPFILFTGRGREEVVIQALNEGADFYLQKGGEPVSQFTELTHKIRQSVQKRQAELAIRDHERREAEIINFLPDATFAIDIHGKVIAWNRAIEEMTGVPAREIIGKADYEYALPFYHERRPVTVDLVLHDNPAVIEKYPVMKKDGSSLFSEIYIPHFNKGRGAHLWFTASPLYDTAGNLTGAIESIRDITERVRAKEALNLEKQRIESLLSLNRMDTRTDAEISAQVIEDAIRLTGSTIGYLATVNDDESVITMQNWSTSAHKSCKIINKPIEYTVEKTGLWGEAVRQRKPVITNDYAAKNPLKRGTPDGHVPLVRHMNIPVFEGDHIVAVAGVGNKDTDYNEGDVRELELLMQGWWQIRVRKRAQEEIRRSNVILKTQQETSPDAILTVNEQRKIINYNQTFIAIWKIPVDLLTSGTNEPVLRHMAGQVADPDAFLTRVQDIYDQKESKNSGDLLLKDGRTLECFSVPMLGEKEEYFGRVWFFRDITRRKVDEDAIRAVQEKFSTIYLQSPDVIWISELESGRFIDVNNAAERIFGYTREEFIGRTSLDLGIWANPSDRKILIPKLQTEGRIERFETIHRRKTGEVFEAESSVSTIVLDGTKYLIATVRDISGIKRVEKALQKSEERFRQLIETTSDWIWETDFTGRYTYVSPNIRDLLGYEPDEIIGKTPFDLMEPEKSEEVASIFAGYISARKPFAGLENVNLHKDGRRIVLETSGVPFFDNRHTFLGYRGIDRDITERKEAEDALRESETKYRELVENANSIIVKLDKYANVIFFNEFAQQFFGYTPDEIIGKPVVGTIVPIVESESGRNLQLLLEEIVHNPKIYFFNENENITRDGKRVWIRWQNKPFLDKNRELEGVLCIGTDITARRQAEEALRKANDELEIRVQEQTAALRESEEKLRLKLDSILMPEADISELDLINTLDITAIQSLMGDFSRLTGMLTAIVDLKGNVIQSSGWQDICKNFHRVDERSARFCMESDLYLARNLKPGQYDAYRCRNNLWDVVTPLFIGDKHVGNVYTGQFFYDNEIIDDAVFVAQAEEFGFDREKYMAALHSVPRFSHEQINLLMDFLVKFSGFISRLSYSNLMLARAMTDQKRVQGELQTLYDELDKRVIERTAELSQAQAAYKQANKKLNLLSSITRHDINNQLLIARGFLKILHQKIPDPAYMKEFTRLEEAWRRISGMIQFTKEYEQVGVSAPVWQDCRVLADTAVKEISLGSVLIKNDLPANAEVFADPLIARVFYNLIDNAIRYGVKISQIHFFLQESADGCCIICEDDGVGVPIEEKEKIFERGFGKNTGMGLWLTREILSITNITIAETGIPDKGARFEIAVPMGQFRSV